MDSLIIAAARALAAGDPLGALNKVALREDAPALALRGTAMAQLGNFSRAKQLLRAAAGRFGAREAAARARCILAEAEVALVSRDLNWPPEKLAAARATLDKHGDWLNATHAQHLCIRRLLLIGRLDEADKLRKTLVAASLPPALRAMHELIGAGIAMRQIRTAAARSALERAAAAGRIAGIPALTAEIESAAVILDAPVARLISPGAARLVRLYEVESLFASGVLLVDACRYAVRSGKVMISLTGRSVLFALARMLAETWPGDVPRDALAQQVFRLRVADEPLRARLRVEMGRLRQLLKPVARIDATARGYVLVPTATDNVAVLARPVEEKHAAVLALLADGGAWAASALALALGTSQRSVQRALNDLVAAGKVQSYGAGRARRWMTPPLPGIATTLLLPAPLSG